MRRIPLWARLALISAGAMLLLQLLAVGVQVTRDDGFSAGGIRPAFARQVAGIVRLFDRMMLPGRRAIALEILNSGQMAVSIETGPQAPIETGPLLSYSAHNVAQRIVAEGVAADRLEVGYVPNDGPTTGPLERMFGRHLRISVRLRFGEYLVIEPDSDVTAFALGTLLSVGAGALGLVVLAIVVFAIYRQTRPLGALAGNMDAFARSAVPKEMAEDGAPEIRSLIRATNTMQQQIAALIKNRALILAGMSHDLRTQLTRLRLRLELLPDSDARSRAIGDVETMQAMTEQTLEFARAGSSADGGKCDLVRVLDRYAEAQRAAERTAVNWGGAAGAIEVAIGETPLRRVIENLVDNAIAYGRQADLSAGATGTDGWIAVADRGPGIPKNQRAEIFEPYYRLDPSRSRAGGGTGLGLAIVEQIVTRHGGRIEVSDRPGGGSVFTVTLPLAGRG